MKILLTILSAILLTSCSTTYKCYPSKGSKDYALVDKERTMKGNKYTFVSGNDTVIKYSTENLTVGKCYTF